jgi:uncharacterized protein (TIGR02757 family)
LVRRYDNPDDAEVAAVFASTLAFGRVAAFVPVIAAVLEAADARGGPAAWVDGFGPADAQILAPLFYRWVRGPDLALLAASIGQLRHAHGSLGAIFVAGHSPAHSDLGPALDHFITLLRQAAMKQAQVDTYGQLSRGVRHGMPRPSGGSGCKRWNMFLRWMVRQPTHPGDPDLGLWDLPIHKLIIPVDTHVLRVARLIGLSHRIDGSWRTAQQITENLARIHPHDPVRYDFALAHLGISGGCKAKHLAEICGSCPLAPCCRFGRVSRPPGGGA